MKKILLFTSLFFGLLIKSQLITDSTIIYTKLDGHPLYSTFVENNCYVTGYKSSSESISDNNLYITHLLKCDDKYYAGVFNTGDFSYINLKNDEELIINDENFTVETLYNIFSKTDNNTIDKLYNNASIISKKNIQSLLDANVDILEKHVNRGIGIFKSSAVDNYGYSDAEFSFINFSKKSIKYITFNYWGENRVEDKVPARSGKIMISSKGIGPIEYFEESYLKFDNIWSTDTIYYLLLDSVDIVYMDGSKKRITILSSDYMNSKIFTEIERLSNKLKKE